MRLPFRPCAIALELSLCALAHAQPSTSTMPSQETAMPHHARGIFQVKLQPLASHAGAGLHAMSIDKTYSGALEATSHGEMISAGDPKSGQAGYVAMESVSGILGGRSGSFALQQFATMDASGAHAAGSSGQHLQVEVAPGSGTGALAGLRGTLTITIHHGEHGYDLEYTLPASGAGSPAH